MLRSSVASRAMEGGRGVDGVYEELVVMGRLISVIYIVNLARGSRKSHMSTRDLQYIEGHY